MSFEIVITDNGSTDGTVEMVRDEYPGVQMTVNSHNLGYTTPMNQALRKGQGRYLMQLNPDTLVLSGAFDRLVDYLDSHPEVGICGPKVLIQTAACKNPAVAATLGPGLYSAISAGYQSVSPKAAFSASI